MVLSVEENPVFVGTPLTSLDVSYAGLTLPGYERGERQEAQLIIDDLRPEYLIGALRARYLHRYLGRERRHPPRRRSMVVEKLHLGCTSWTHPGGGGDGHLEQPGHRPAPCCRQTSIDYLDVHVYPFGPERRSPNLPRRDGRGKVGRASRS